MASESIAISTFQDVTVVTFREASMLDTLVVDAIGKDLYALVDEQARRKIVLDFTSVHFLSSSMIGIVLALHKKSCAIKGKVVICGLQPKILDVFKVASLHKLLKIVDDEAAAFKALDVHV